MQDEDEKKNWTLDNVVEYIHLVDRLCMDKLMNKAIEFIVENSSDATLV